MQQRLFCTRIVTTRCAADVSELMNQSGEHGPSPTSECSWAQRNFSWMQSTRLAIASMTGLFLKKASEFYFRRCTCGSFGSVLWTKATNAGRDAWKFVACSSLSVSPARVSRLQPKSKTT